LTDSTGTVCLADGFSLFTGVSSTRYWSQTTIASFPLLASYVHLITGAVSDVDPLFGGKGAFYNVWPVRAR